MTFSNPVVGGVTLVRPAIQSPNYVHASAGWTVNQDGSAEFNNLTVRNGVSVSGVSLYYNGTPAAGTLVASVAPSSGTDSYGNAYVAGFAVYSGSTVEYHVDLSGNITVGSTATGGFQLQPGTTPSFNQYDDLGQLTVNFDANSGIISFLDNTNMQFVQFNVNGNGVPGGMILGSLATTGALPTLTEQQQAGAVTISSNGNNLWLIAPTSATAPKAAQIYLTQGQNSTGTGATGVPQVRIFADPTSSPSDVDVLVSGSLIKTNKAASNAAYTWTPPTMGTGWASGPASGTVQALQVKPNVLDQLDIQGAMHVSGTPSSTCFTLPAGMAPVAPQRVGCVCNNANTVTAAFLDIATSGAVTITPVPSAGDVYIDAHPRLGHVS